MMTDTRVIIIDDDRLNNMVCRKMIDVVSPGRGPEVVDFTDPEAGLEYVHHACDTTHPEHMVLLLDLNMPVMSGWEFLDEFAKFNDSCKSSITVFIVSSSLDPRDYKRATLDPNVSGLLVKPLSKEMLQRLITFPAQAAA